VVADQTELDIITETTAVVSDPVADQSVQDNSAAAADQSVNEVAADTSTANKSAAEASQNGISVLSTIDDSTLQAAVDTSCDSVHEVIVQYVFAFVNIFSVIVSRFEYIQGDNNCETKL